jgi:hypothetical protein
MNTTDTPDIITQLNTRIADELTAIDREERFRDMIDSCYGDTVKIAGYEYTTSHALETLDPTAFRCGVNDYADSENWVEINGDYYEQADCERIKDEMQDELESSIADKEQEIEEEHANENQTQWTLGGMITELNDLQDDLAALKAHSF